MVNKGNTHLATRWSPMPSYKHFTWDTYLFHCLLCHDKLSHKRGIHLNRDTKENWIIQNPCQQSPSPLPCCWGRTCQWQTRDQTGREISHSSATYPSKKKYTHTHNKNHFVLIASFPEPPPALPVLYYEGASCVDSKFSAESSPHPMWKLL